jgi:hypothetical protein
MVLTACVPHVWLGKVIIQCGSGDLPNQSKQTCSIPTYIIFLCIHMCEKHTSHINIQELEQLKAVLLEVDCLSLFHGKITE